MAGGRPSRRGCGLQEMTSDDLPVQGTPSHPEEGTGLPRIEQALQPCARGLGWLVAHLGWSAGNQSQKVV